MAHALPDGLEDVEHAVAVGLAGHEGRYGAFEEAKFTQTVSTPTITQAAIAEFLVDGGYDRHLRALRRSLREQVLRMREAVARHFPPGTRMTAPQGGFLLWVEMPDSSVDALELQRRALRARISIAPGPIFSVRGEFEHCSRLNCDYRWTDEIEQAMATLRRLSRP